MEWDLVGKQNESMKAPSRLERYVAVIVEAVIHSLGQAKFAVRPDEPDHNLIRHLLSSPIGREPNVESEVVVSVGVDDSDENDLQCAKLRGVDVHHLSYVELDIREIWLVRETWFVPPPSQATRAARNALVMISVGVVPSRIVDLEVNPLQIRWKVEGVAVAARDGQFRIR